MRQGYDQYDNRSIWDKTWKDRQGRVVIWQSPNRWLIGWAAFTTISLFFTGRMADAFSWIGSALLIIWSLLEISRGSSYFRRLLGAVVLALALASLVKSI